MENKRVAVTGASGHIGANLIRELLGRAYQVVVLVRHSSDAFEGLDVVKINGDILNAESLRLAFTGVDQVYHLAAHISIESGDKKKLQQVNVEGTRHVLEACQSQGVATLIHFSSVHALNPEPLDQAVTEDNAPLGEQVTGGGDYDYSKAAAERLIKQNQCKTLGTRIIYPTGVFGPHDFKRSLFGQALIKMAQGSLPALVSGGFDWVDARDVAWGAVEAAEKGKDGDRFLLSGHYLSMSEVAAVVAELTGVAAPLLTCPTWLASIFAPLMGAWSKLMGQSPLYTRDSLAALSTNKVMSHQYAATQLGYAPRPFRHSMVDTMAFYKDIKQLDTDSF